MGKVTENLIKLIKKQLAEKGIVVWYDPQRRYFDIFKTIDLPDTTTFSYESSFFKLRNEMDSLVEFLGGKDRPTNNCGVPSKVLVYVPLLRHETNNALVEFDTSGTVLEPGAGSLERNTRLRVIAESVFSKIAPDQTENICRQIDADKLSLAELDKIAGEVAAVGSAVIKLIFGTTSLDEVVMRFAAVDDYDAEVEKKDALSEISALFEQALGFRIEGDLQPPEARYQIQKHLMMTAFLAAFPEEKVPEVFSFIALPERKDQIDAATRICRVWRNRADFVDAYVSAARMVEQEIGLDGIDFPIEPFVVSYEKADTFPILERRLIERCESLILDGNPEATLNIAEQRLKSFWALREPVLQLRWTLIEYSARTLVLGKNIKAELKTAGKDLRMMTARYSDSETPWCRVDTYYRRLEHQYAVFDIEIGREHEKLQRLIARVRTEYTQTLEAEIEAYTAAVAAADFHLEGIITQDKIFPQFVAPLLKKNKKTAFVLVDALRYEMGRDLVEGLGVDFNTELTPAVSMLPSLTSVGMAALLPDAGKGIELKKSSGGKLFVDVAGSSIKNRTDRINKLLEISTGVSVCCKLNQLIKPSKKLQNEIKASNWVVVTSQELDRWGEEGDGDDEIRIFMDEVLDKLGKGIRRLAALGIDHIVLTADHGHLFGEAIEGGMRMDAPGGETSELHGRVWVGKGGTTGDGFLRVTADQLGLGGDFELAFPRSLACFKTKGGTRAYCHGGISLQEMIIPVITLKQKETEQHFTQAKVKLEMTAAKITNRFFSITALYEEKGLFAAGEIRVKVVVKSGRKEVGSVAMAAYGFDAAVKEISLKNNVPNPITLMLTTTEDVEKVTISILDAGSLVELGGRKDISVDITI